MDTWWIYPAARPVCAAAQDGKSSAGPLTIGHTTAAPFQPDLDITLRSRPQALTWQSHRRDGLRRRNVVFHPPEYHKNFQTVWTTALSKVPYPRVLRISQALTRDFAPARSRSAEQYQHAIEDLSQWAEDTRRIFGTYDVVVTPVLVYPPKPHVCDHGATG